MANWCSNTVRFTGNEESADKILQLFKAMMEQENKSGEGQIPDFVQHKDGYFFEIYQNETEECSFQYETKWCPNIEVLYLISDHYKAEFVLEYTELGSCIYGRTTYQNKVLDDVCLDFSDFDKFQHMKKQKPAILKEKPTIPIWRFWKSFWKGKLMNKHN